MPLIWRILLKDAVKVDSVVKFSAVVSCAMRMLHYSEADYLKRFGHHAIDIQAAVVARCQMAYCQIEAVKLTQKKLK
jgi:hypothetical protein